MLLHILMMKNQLVQAVKPTPSKKLAFGEIATRYLGYNASKSNLTDNNYGIKKLVGIIDFKRPLSILYNRRFE